MQHLALSLLLLAGLARPLLAQEGGAGAVVLCHDPGRRIVQTVLAKDCDGRIVSEDEAAAIREEERLARARLLQKPRYSPESRKGGGGPGRRRAMSFGSAFPIDDAGRFLTARHVVDACKDILIGSADGVTRSAYLVAAADDADIALLRSMPVPSYFRFEPEPPAPGAPVRAVGYPEEGRPRITPVATEGRVEAADFDIAGNFILFDAPVRSGNSGGPLLSPEGRLVGMVIAKQNAVKAYATTGERKGASALALSVRALRDFLEGTVDAPAPSGDAGDAVEAEVYRVICER